MDHRKGIPGLRVERVGAMNTQVLAGLFMFVTLAASFASADVPKPYTPVKASDSEFRCLGRTTKLGAMLLPAQITAAGEPLLKSPVRIAPLDGITGKGKLISNDGNSAVWEWQGESSAFKIAVRMTADCDGLAWYDITLTPKQPVKLSSLRLEVPRREETARYIHAANFSWGQQLSSGLREYGGKWNQKFMPYVWLGDEDRGLGWTAESDQTWRLREPTNALLVETKGDTVLFATTFLDHEETIDSPVKLSFGLQATPVKPVTFQWRANARIFHDTYLSNMEPNKYGRIRLDTLKNAGVKTVVYHDQWSEYFGQLKPAKPEEFRKFIAECHKRGIRFIVYIGYGIARNAPEMQVKGRHDEWSALPLIPWIPGYKPEFRTFDATCARSGWQEWLVTGIEKLFTDYDLDGLYFDGTTEAFRCENESHGCGWRDKDGKVHATYCVRDVRNTMRRIADAVHNHKPDAILDAHMSASLTIPTLSFLDSYWDGEQYESYTAADKVEIPLDAFRAEFMGWAHGLDAQFLCYINRPFTTEEAIAIAGLHGVEVRPDGIKQVSAISRLWGAYDRFGMTSATWLPYWKGSGVTADDAEVKASAWSKGGRALIFVSHLKREPLTTTLHLDRRKLGLGQGALTMTDAITGQPLKPAGDALPIDFKGMTYRLIEVRE